MGFFAISLWIAAYPARGSFPSPISALPLPIIVPKAKFAHGMAKTTLNGGSKDAEGTSNNAEVVIKQDVFDFFGT